uniref:PK_Tyr_Ser-Thr domain-containing protein n=1 Tax=Panagrellus redivivus TaxID=6233 RepID=A0A7E4W7Y6_PANRE
MILFNLWVTLMQLARKYKQSKDQMGFGAEVMVGIVAGDDATAVRWVTLNRQTPENLYASHEDFIEILMKHHHL